MKRILIILLYFVSGYAYAQKLPDTGLNKIRITENEKTIVAEIDLANDDPVAKTGLFYYWYSANMIHITQGGYSGKLLNGVYSEYYLNKNLREQGFFKSGLKDGTWKSWNEDGTLNQATEWRKGAIYIKKPSAFWKKINIFKKKAKHQAADSTANP